MSIDDIEKQIQSNSAIMLYFSGENCGVCSALMPKIQDEFQNNFPKIKQLYINASDYPEIAAYYSIFTVPSVLVYFDSKETKRESRHISVSQLVQSTSRHYNLFFD